MTRNPQTQTPETPIEGIKTLEFFKPDISLGPIFIADHCNIECNDDNIACILVKLLRKHYKDEVIIDDENIVTQALFELLGIPHRYVESELHDDPALDEPKYTMNMYEILPHKKMIIHVVADELNNVFKIEKMKYKKIVIRAICSTHVYAKIEIQNEK